MESPTLEYLDSFRIQGYKPEVVVCFICSKKILFFFKREYGLWILPQASIVNGEVAEQALVREMSEEVGVDFLAGCSHDFTYFGEDKADFLQHKQGIEELKTDSGEKIKMLGKKYFFYIVNSSSEHLDIEKTEFDDFVWLPYNPAMFIASHIPQPTKKVVVVKVLEELHKADVL